MGLTGFRASSSSKDEQFTKSERKFEKKLHFYSKVRETVASLSAKKTITKKSKLRSRQKKLKAYDLSSLNELLPEIKESQQAAVLDVKLNCKSRQKLIEKEGNRLKAVLSNPAFRSDPFAALHQHLQNTQPILSDKKPVKSSTNRKKNKSKKSKALPGDQAMDTQ
ncbi:hypothetical protein Syun_015192 [Stephania yunnanensis]|uniref:Ribosome biogenesis protein slx9-like n=1 Tax=Stephania yunnanensis TaxID=152371 RepID=A0AAP0P9H1_9MAGN